MTVASYSFRIFLFLALLATGTSGWAQTWQFVNVTNSAGVSYNHGYTGTDQRIRRAIAGGVAAGDYDNDGWIDLYLVRGNIGPNVLLRNKGDGTFEERGAFARVALTGTSGSGPFFADLNGDGWLDLFVGGIDDTDPTLFINRGDGRFRDATEASGIDIDLDTYSAAAGDYDRDGDLDLFLTHWTQAVVCSRLWENLGDATFRCVDEVAGVMHTEAEFSFTANFADIDNDGWLDILLASDFTYSQVFLNNRDGTFSDITDPVISDENGMGAAIGDYDNDGDLDWFVSSIWDDELPPPSQNWGITGNRLYRNRGDGTFDDATEEAGVRVGDWGWGASFADFNNDGHLDIYHVNGWPYEVTDFLRDPARLFVSNGDGTFTERGAELGADHLGQGRGIVIFDYDRDGDLDIFITATRGRCQLLRNDGGNALNYLTIKLRGISPNSEAVGARVYVTAGGETQFRELRAGCNFESQNPVEAHFGLGTRTSVDSVRIVWPDSASTTLGNVSVNQLLIVDYPLPPVTTPPAALDLGQNHPNPFNPETRIPFAISEAARISLLIYDASGKLVRTLIDRHMTPGTYTEAWDGLDASGRSVASGVYYYELSTPTGTLTRKAVRVK